MLNKLIIFTLFIYNLSFSQLSVRNNAYIFVDNEVVFVEDDINLNEASSSIYLRNESQLIQGAGTTGNSGIGELSVYQEANAGEYEYNYWCSPIGDKTNNLINNPFGISLLNDATGLITSTPATFVSSASFNGTSTPLNIEPYWVWKFISSNGYSEWIHIKGSTAINPGEGFTMKGTAGSGNAQRYDFRGKPNNGTIAVAVLNNHFTLAGNPYPSAMDAAAYLHDTQNAAVINGSLYFWEQDQTINSHALDEYSGGYASYTINAAGTVETFVSAVFNTYNDDGTINVTNTGTGNNVARRYIPIGQGFMVEGVANGMVRAKNEHRAFIKESAGNSQFFRPSEKKEKNTTNENRFSEVPDDYKRFRLNIDFNNRYTRQLVQTFHDTANKGFDYGLESYINSSDILSSDAYWTIDNNSYISEALPLDIDLKIPLVIQTNENVPIRIRIADIQNFDSASPIYIHDIEKDTFINLKDQDFEINLESGAYKERFEITFSKTVLNNTEDTFKNLKIFQNNRTSQLKVLNKSNLEIKTFSLYDVTGKQVMNDRMASSKSKYTYSTKTLNSGVYIVKIELKNQQVFNKKIIIN
ncbi:MAG: T9SS type A sorting domain-containing protein [Algibacter sp.]|uniref:T9SS type A sorting domain-containing protein n=1 Tax=Algibacter sp. TaxID=1872428 RepID=UPI0026182207|nr:T9SS type A sorting domain-containing protein [Algibacter sp.]MDG1729388.1 T9SS type A sorting domain-containing protein [Algibacter sp.]MDG2178600.1 T9SS type A sorting domain-containing protein [Algibacter sp.]